MTSFSDRISELFSDTVSFGERWTDSETEQQFEPVEEDVLLSTCTSSNRPELPTFTSPVVLWKRSVGLTVLKSPMLLCECPLHSQESLKSQTQSQAIL